MVFAYRTEPIGSRYRTSILSYCSPACLTLKLLLFGKEDRSGIIQPISTPAAKSQCAETVDGIPEMGRSVKMGKGTFVSNFRRLWPLALGAFVLAGTACEAIATQGARDAVETSREVRELEDTEIRPLEDELRALIEDEIEPLQDELEDLYFQEREIQDTVIRPLWDSQVDPWGPGGELFVIQQEFEAKFQDIERQYREIELEERQLQTHFNGGAVDPYQSPEMQLLEDKRYELQRQLDKIYRRGWDPVNEIYDEINFLSQSFNWSDPGTNDRVNELNDKINHLYDEASRVQQSIDGDANDLWSELDQVSNELNNLATATTRPITRASRPGPTSIS